ncbi:MAG: hypothetical protein WCO45_11720 [Pseudanabaena sp. ELA607]|jgi:hypothetical protein
MSDIIVVQPTKYKVDNNHPYLRKWDLHRATLVQKRDIASVRGVYQHLSIASVRGIYAYESTATYTDSIHTPYNDSASFTQDVHINKIDTLFRIQDESVLTFIFSKPELAKLLLEAYKHIRERFPSETLGLGFVDDMPNKIEICICAPADNDETFLKFNDFNENWWFPRLDEEDLAIYPFIVLNFWG